MRTRFWNIHKLTSLLALVSLAVLVAGCSASLKDYKNTEPQFTMEEFLADDLVAWGMVQDYTGKVTRRFCVEINGSWEASDAGALQGTIEETFYFDDGEQDERTWIVQKHERDGEAVYTGTAGDVVGTAKGQSQGFAFYWEYDLMVPIESDDGSENVYQFHIKDWIYQLSDSKAMNRSALEKFGIELGQLTIFFDKNTAVCETATR